MKSFNALTTIVLVAMGSAVWADDPTALENVPQSEAQPYVEAEQFDTVDDAYYPPVTEGAHSDFPGYYPGYTSYRVMGSCCEQPSCCAQNAWDGYCEQKAYDHQSLFHGWKDKLHCCLPKLYCPTICCPPVKACDAGCVQKSCDSGCCQKDCPESTCCGMKPWLGLPHFGWTRPAWGVKGECCDAGCDQKECPKSTCCDAKPRHCLFGKLGCGLHRAECCDPCCEEVGGKYEVAAPTWHDKLHHKLQGLGGYWGGLWQGAPANVYGTCCEPAQGKGMWMPADQQYREMPSTPEPAAESDDEPTAEPSNELPQPAVSTDYVPNFPNFNNQDRSAWRQKVHRLPNASMSF